MPQLTDIPVQILVTAYTNNAVDNVLVKLKEIGVPFARVCGKEHVTHEAIASHVLNADGCRTTAELKASAPRYLVPPVT